MQEPNPSTNGFITQLQAALGNGLPGREAQFVMAPSARPPEPPHPMIPASVLIALYRQEGSWHFPLIHRVDDGYPHGGQISLPGGRNEDGETAEECAIREAHEEVGLEPSKLNVLGELSPLPIPVSGYTATPVVALYEGVPAFRIQPSEVQSVFVANSAELADPANEHTEMRSFFGKESTIPYYMLGGQKVWGATAMMLAEFRRVLRSL